MVPTVKTRQAPLVKIHTKGMWWNSDINRLWACHRLCNPPAPLRNAPSLAEARHWRWQFTRYFRKIWRVSQSALMWNLCLKDRVGKRCCKINTKERENQISRRIFVLRLWNVGAATRNIYINVRARKQRQHIKYPQDTRTKDLIRTKNDNRNNWGHKHQSRQRS